MNLVRIRGSVVGIVAWHEIALVLGAVFVAGFVVGLVWL